MSWRRFSNLLNNISNDSVYVMNIQSIKEGNIAVEHDDATTDRIVDNFFN